MAQLQLEFVVAVLGGFRRSMVEGQSQRSRQTQRGGWGFTQALLLHGCRLSWFCPRACNYLSLAR